MNQENDAISKVLLSIEHYKGNYSKFRQGILTRDYNARRGYFSRLLLWKTCLMTKTLNTREWKNKLKTCRALYHELSKQPKMSVPWWLLERESEFFMRREANNYNSTSIEPQKSLRLHHVTDDPLSNSGEHLGNDTKDMSETDEDLLNTIILDVKRLFPGDPTFHASSKASFQHRRRIVKVLFIWSKCNPQIGYKQGLHEILGLIYKIILGESLAPLNLESFSVTDLNILSLYDSNYLNHDLFFLFNKFVLESGVVGSFYESEAALMSSIQYFDEMLMKIDQIIHYNLITKLKLDSQLWVIRFFRLLLLRELGNNLDVTATFWDRLAAVEASSAPGDHSIPLIISFSVIVLLIHLKADLALSDFAEALTLLLHYPISARINTCSYFVETIFEDAIKLFDAREDDFKLYETGLHLNKKYVESITGVRLTSRHDDSNPLDTRTKPQGKDTKKINMAFEKSRLELRLKKRAQSILRSGK